MIFFIESDYKTLLLSMLSDYINSCESIKTTVGNNGTSGTQGGSSTVGTSPSQTNTCTTEASSPSPSTCSEAPSCPTTTGGGTSNCSQTSAAQPASTSQNCNTVQPQQAQTQTAAQSNNECSFKVFCEKVKNGTCNVLKEIECKECKECTGSEEICTKFISVTIEHCEKEAECLIIQLNEDLSPELLNTIVLRFIGLLLYLRIIQEFSLLREYFTKIIENLSTCYNTIKSCTCGSAGQSTNNNCSKDSKCVCTIFYKLFQAIKTLHNRYCKIIGYIRGECDVDLYKTIPSLSLTRSVIILTSYFNNYINSGYMVEESSCGCGYNEYVEPSLIRSVTGIAIETLLLLLNTVTKTEYTGLRRCPCHKYSSKLDDVVTLLQTGIDDTDDCDGLLSDVISMISPLVKVEDYRFVTLKTELKGNEDTTKKKEIDQQLQEVKKEKEEKLKEVIGSNINSSCEENSASGGGGSGSSTTECNSCSTESASTDTANTPCSETNGGTIATACQAYNNGDGGTTGTCNDGGSTQCKCECDACANGKSGECCCFYRHQSCPCETADNSSKTCLANLVGLLKTDGLQCNTTGNGNSLMCYLCLLKCSICKLKDACNSTGANGNGCNLDEALGKLPDHIKEVVEKICGNGTETTLQECCKNCNGNCSENGTCKCEGGNCCKVNNRFSNFTKFLLGTCATSTETSNNKCKTITDTLIQLNGTLKKFLENGAQNGDASNGCTCNNGSACTNNCCCGLTNCSKDNGCKENKPINILSCVIECGLNGIKNRSTNIETHITEIEKCLECICDKMNKLEKCYCELHENISELKNCVTNGKSCIDGKICSLAKAKQENQGKFKEVIDKSRDVLSDICGLYRVYSMESYSYYLSP